ncbi:DUF6049 family protein [Nonomuraea sp. NPDC050404]|uniref:DUF6049 family protein n=1 Tax=Nonomuraea sp. NPDC050404 TaxID=3155783 RepID=UPI0033F1CB5B
MIRKAALLAALSAALLAPLVAVTPSTAAARTSVPNAAAANVSRTVAAETSVPSTAVAKTSVTATRQNLSVSIGSITPEVPKNVTDVIKFTGTVRNDTGTTQYNVAVRLLYDSRPFTGRAAMAAWDADPAARPPNVSRSSRMPFTTLEPGAEQRWEFTATPAQLGYRSFGVYPIGVDVAVNEVSQQAQRTYLTYAPATTPRKPRNKLAIALPVIDQPRRGTDDSLFIDDKLSQALTGRGRLADLAKIAQSAPSTVTWFVEPGLLDDVNAMSKGYRVKVKDGAPQTKPASTTAAQWLTTMRSSLAASPVVAVPYADPDVAALAHQGLDTQTNRAIELGGQTAKALINPNAKTNLNWPAVGVLDPDALDLLSISGVNTVLLNATNLPTEQQRLQQQQQQDQSATTTPTVTTATEAVTPDAAATLDSVNGPVTALVADAGLSRLFEPESGTSTLLSTQRFIAETAMISAEPGQTAPRSLVVAPSRRWDPNPTLVTTLIKAAGRLPWLELSTLESLKPSKASVPRTGLVYTEQDRKEELTGKYLAPVRDAWSKAQLTSLITEDKTASGFDAAVLRLTSSAWRNNTRVGRSVTKLVSAAVDARTGDIQITGAQPDMTRTLAGSNGVVPISVKNERNVKIQLYIDVKSDNPELLQVNFSQLEPLAIGGGQSGTVQVPMNAAPDTNGNATVTVQLRTADGQAYGKPQRLTIRTTGYTGIALVIVGAALTVMLAAVVTRLLRRRSERRLARAAKNRESETV